MAEYLKLPPAYSAYLLHNPINAEISEIKQSRPKDSMRVTDVLLNVGTAQGVKKGMEFYLYMPSNIFESATVMSVNSASPEAEIFQCCDDKAGPPSVGWKLSTSDTIRKAVNGWSATRKVPFAQIYFALIRLWRKVSLYSLDAGRNLFHRQARSVSIEDGLRGR